MVAHIAIINLENISKHTLICEKHAEACVKFFTAQNTSLKFITKYLGFVDSFRSIKTL